MRIFLVAFICFFFHSNKSLKAQNQFSLYKDSVYTFKLLDNKEVSGILINSTDSTYTLWVISNRHIIINKNNIKQIVFHPKEPDLFKKAKPYPPQSYRYLLSPSAYNLKEGKLYYQCTDMFFNSLNYGISNQLSIGGGFIILPVLVGDVFRHYYLNLKWAKPTGKYFNLGINFQYVKIKGVSEDRLYNIDAQNFNSFMALGVMTYGSKSKNITLSIGLSPKSSKKDTEPIMNLCAMLSDEKNMAIVTESWYIPNINNILINKEGLYIKEQWWGEVEPILISGAFRKWSKRTSWDFGVLFAKKRNSSIIFLPIIDFVIRSKD